jgi:alpha-ketoglutarate-dependent taurine dioxygenase
LGSPVVFQPAAPARLDDLDELVDSNSEAIKDTLHREGAVLLRGFPIDDVESFLHTVEKLGCGSFMDYTSGDAPRTKVAGYAYSSTDAPSFMHIPLHNEMSYARDFPRNIYFFCYREPSVGGETIIGDARKVYAGINRHIREQFERAGVRYTLRFYRDSSSVSHVIRYQKGHKSWAESFGTDDKVEVEQKCRQLGCKYSWMADDWLKVDRDQSACMRHPETGETVWFNQVHLYETTPRFVGWKRYLTTKLLCPEEKRYTKASFGDGSAIPRRYIEHILDVLHANSIYFRWKKGDMLILDNLLIMHGRSPFEGDRRVLVTMTR